MPASAREVCYIFGYGSLISQDSRARTAPSAAWHPVTVKGLQRYWSRLTPCYGYSAVVVKPAAEATCNGVLFEIDCQDLPAFDQRESAYRRVSLPADSVVASGDLPAKPLWAYVMDEPLAPSAQAPIVQSYLDVILDGALRIAPRFAAEFLEQTAHWNAHWVDDRQAPRYRRPLRERDYQGQINALLADFSSPHCPSSLRSE